MRTGETTIICTEEPYACRARVTACHRVNIWLSTIVCSASAGLESIVPRRATSPLANQDSRRRHRGRVVEVKWEVICLCSVHLKGNEPLRWPFEISTVAILLPRKKDIDRLESTSEFNDWKYCWRFLILRSTRALAKDNEHLTARQGQNRGSTSRRL